MTETKKGKRMREFSLTNFFFVTGVSFLAFTGAMKILDGVTISILLKIGLISLGLATIAFLFKVVVAKWDERSNISSQDNQGY
jgi:hypothetical protein